MNYHPILFSTPMMKANLAGKKTMTRRIIRGLPDCGFVDLEINPEICFEGDTDRVKTLKGLYATFESYGDSIETFPMRKSKYVVGDILWVRETWNGLRENKRAGIPAQYWYKADDESMNPDDRWVPSIFMPKEACRLFLRVTDVRVERVQDITDADARAEGCGESDVVYYNGALKCMFFELWDSINAKRGFGWEKNPWVWVYTYERVDKPEGWCA